MPPLLHTIRRGPGSLRTWINTGTGLILAATASAANVGLKWNPNPEAGVVRYEVKCATCSGNQERMIDAGPATRLTVTGLEAGTSYRFSVTAVDSSGARSDPSDEVIYQSPASGDPTALIPRALNWQPTADSEESAGYAAAMAFDGNASTFWHTAWRSGTSSPPHEIRLDLGSPHVLGGFRYLPRQDGFTVGNIGTYGFFVSMDGVEWHAAVATGTFAPTKDEKQVIFPPTYARHIRLVEYTETSGYRDCNVAELSLLGFAATGELPKALVLESRTSCDTPVGVCLKSERSSIGPLDYQITRLPLHGSISGAPPDVIYSPAPGFTGLDSFSYQVSDGIAASSEAVVEVTVAPMPDFSTWVASHGASGGISGDTDSDGLPNGIEFMLGTDPSRNTGPGWLPTFETARTDPERFVFTYRRSDAANSDASISIQVQWAAAPSGAWTNAAETPGIESETVNDGAAPGIDEIKVRIPRSLTKTGKMFARVGISTTNP